MLHIVLLDFDGFAARPRTANFSFDAASLVVSLGNFVGLG